MKTLVTLILIGLIQVGLAIEVPYSRDLIKTDTNHLSGMARISPADQQAIPLQTDCWLWHDGKNLYVYWEMEIDQDFEPGAFATRDDNQASDYVRFQVKTIANEDFAYYFSAFPRGTAFDAVRKENLQIDNAWNSLYSCTSEYTDKEWTVLMTIPFRDLRFDTEPPYNWTFTIARQVQSTVSSYANPYTPITGRTPRQYYDSFEPLIIREKIESPKNYYVIPYFYRSYDFLTEENSFDPKHLGVNLIYRPTSSSSVKMAFNPDFTEVPVDEERDSHNDKYPPQLTENRLFFTEDLNAFGVSESQFYSRNIMQPAYALKFTSSGKNWNLGFLSAHDKETSIEGVVVNPADDYNILAFKPQFGRYSQQFTLLARTNTEDKDYNYLFYSAPSYQVSPSWIIQSRFAFSADQTAGADYNYGYLAAISTDQRLFWNIMSSLSARVISDNYLPAMGSAYAQNDVNQYGGNITLSYDKFYSNSLLRMLNLGASSNLVLQKDGAQEVRSFDISNNMNFTFTPQFSLSMNSGGGLERMPANGELIPWQDFSGNISLNRWRLISGYLGGSSRKIMLYSMIDPQKAYSQYTVSGGVNGFLGPVISYIFRNTHVMWKDLPAPLEYYDGLQRDDEYDITNLDMELTFNNDLKIVTGVRYNNYNIQGFQQHVGYFATLHYWVNASTKVYMGFKSTEDEYLDTMYKTSETAWFKITKTF